MEPFNCKIIWKCSTSMCENSGVRGKLETGWTVLKFKVAFFDDVFKNRKHNFLKLCDRNELKTRICDFSLRTVSQGLWLLRQIGHFGLIKLVFCLFVLFCLEYKIIKKYQFMLISWFRMFSVVSDDVFELRPGFWVLY